MLGCTQCMGLPTIVILYIGLYVAYIATALAPCSILSQLFVDRMHAHIGIAAMMLLQQCAVAKLHSRMGSDAEVVPYNI